MKPYSAASVFIDNSINGKIGVLSEIDKVKYYDPFISDVYIDRSCIHRKVIDKWAEKARVRINDGNFNMAGHRSMNGRIVVVYLGRNRNSQEYHRAKQQANELNCDLILLP
jgi:hypothetical protein